MKTLMFYDVAPDGFAKIPACLPGQEARLKMTFHDWQDALAP